VNQTFTPKQLDFLAEVINILDDIPATGEGPGESDGLNLRVQVFDGAWPVGTFTRQETSWLFEVTG
jgi:hypothetical protein